MRGNNVEIQFFLSHSCILPSHMGISGNERADSAAKAALQKDVSDCLISYTDAYQYISQYVSDWDTAVNNKLHATKPLIGEQLSAYRSVRRDEVVLFGLKLGHSYLTHSYLLKGEQPPECVTCSCRLTISHILVDCIVYDFFRLILFENNLTLTDIFNNVSPNKIISFIKRAVVQHFVTNLFVLFKCCCCCLVHYSGELVFSSLVLFGI